VARERVSAACGLPCKEPVFLLLQIGAGALGGIVVYGLTRPSVQEQAEGVLDAQTISGKSFSQITLPECPGVAVHDQTKKRL